MPKCPNCKQDLVKLDDGKFKCPSCGNVYRAKQPEAQTPAQNVNDELEALKARLAALEAEKELAQTNPTNQSVAPKKPAASGKMSAAMTKVAATPAWHWIKKHWYVVLASALGLIIFITLMTTLVGIRGIYVNIYNPNEFYSFTATSYEYHGTSMFGGGDYVDKGTWKKSGNKLLLTYKDEDFGKITEENIILENNGNKVLALEDEFGMQKTFKRVNLVNYSAVVAKAKVTFDPNGGSFLHTSGSSSWSSSSSEVYKTKIGNKINMDLDVTRNSDKIRFMGWYTEPYGYKSQTAQQYISDARVWESTTYYANWYNPTVYNIVYNGVKVEIHEGDLLLPKIQELNEKITQFQFEYYFDGKSIDENTIYTPTKKITRKLIGDIPNGITEIPDCAFIDCINDSFTIPDSVTSIGDMVFYECSKLTSITIPDSVTSIGKMAFYECSKLTSITIPDSVTSIGSGAFEGCSGLKEVHITDIAKWCAISFIDRDNPLYYAHNLYLNGKLVTDLVIPDSVTIIGNRAFYRCSGLTSITIPDSVTSIGSGAFEGCSGLTSVTIGDSVTSIGSDAFYGTAWYDNQRDGVVYAGKTVYAYKGTMPKNTSITIKVGTKVIGREAFYDCSGLTSITIPNSVTSIDYRAFFHCSGLTSITIPNSVTSIGIAAFSGCSGLTSITIPDSVTSIGDNAFSGCSELTSITIPDSVTSIGDNAFSGCSELTSITIPDSVTSIGEMAFRYCSGLTSITFKGTKTQWKAIKKVSYWNYETGNFIIHCIDGNLDKNGNEI